MEDVLAVPVEKMDPIQAEMNLRIAHYLRAIEGVLFKNGLAGLDEINKAALRSVGLDKMDRLQAFLKSTEDAISRIPNPETRSEELMRWEFSDEKTAVTHAISEMQQQIASTMED